MTIERPMFPPRAESVDSFSHQAGIGQRERDNRTGESCRPAEGLSRRTLLGAIAVLPVAPAVAADLPPPDGFERVVDDRGRTWFKAIDEDPVFALIAEKRAADVVHGEACDALTKAEMQYGVGSDEADEVYEEGGPACTAAMEACWPLATIQPTTIAGVLAVLRFANAIEDGGMEWPNTDTVGAEGWHYQLRATMALAIETIIRKGAV
jgi:hypothetical protein